MKMQYKMRRGVLALLFFVLLGGPGDATECVNGPCSPGNEQCGPEFTDAPQFHIRDQSCAENDPNGPVYDETHGMYHLFYQDHLAEGDGSGPIYGHVASRDFVHWW